MIKCWFVRIWYRYKEELSIHQVTKIITFGMDSLVFLCYEKKKSLKNLKSVSTASKWWSRDSGTLSKELFLFFQCIFRLLVKYHCLDFGHIGQKVKILIVPFWNISRTWHSVLRGARLFFLLDHARSSTNTKSLPVYLTGCLWKYIHIDEFYCHRFFESWMKNPVFIDFQVEYAFIDHVKFSLWSSSIGITWEIVRNAESLMPLQNNWIWIWVLQGPLMSYIHTQVW